LTCRVGEAKRNPPDVLAEMERSVFLEKGAAHGIGSPMTYAHKKIPGL